MLILLCVGLSTSSFAQEKPLSHVVQIKAKIVPLFVVDGQNKPVFDLKQEDISLLVNNKEVPFQFYSFKNEETSGSAKIVPAKRNIFLVIDSLFKTDHGFFLSKQIVEKLVKDAFTEEDLITILEISPMGGLRHIHGPSTDKDILVQKVRALKQFPDQFMKIPQEHRFPTMGKPDEDPTAETGGLGGDAEVRMDNKIKKMDAEYGKWTSIFYIKTLQKMQYLLKMTENRKLVFLVSQGTPHSIFVDRKQMDFVKDTLKSINTSETIFYTIFPKRESYEELRKGLHTGDTLLRYLAVRAGGRHFEGSDPNVITKQVRQTTSAYYELVFSPTAEMGKVQSIKIGCKKPGVKLYFAQNTFKPDTYSEMPKIQQKIFALDVATDGKWSRSIAKVEQISLAAKPEKVNNRFKVRIDIPQSFQNKTCDIYFLSMNQELSNPSFELKTKKLSSLETFSMASKDNFKSFVVLVEPKSNNCIFATVSQ